MPRRLCFFATTTGCSEVRGVALRSCQPFPLRRWSALVTMKLQWLAVSLALVAAMLAYGAWRAHTHASVWLNVNDHAGRTANRLWVGVTDGRVMFRDATGRVLAEAALEPPQGLPRWTGPEGEAVDCRPQLDRDAWQACYARQSRWMARWAPQVLDARVTVGRCVVDRVPVARRSSTDWWLWWVPLPHVGGTPSGHHTLELHLDSARCSAASAR